MNRCTKDTNWCLKKSPECRKIECLMLIYSLEVLKWNLGSCLLISTLCFPLRLCILKLSFKDTIHGFSYKWSTELTTSCILKYLVPLLQKNPQLSNPTICIYVPIIHFIITVRKPVTCLVLGDFSNQTLTTSVAQSFARRRGNIGFSLHWTKSFTVHRKRTKGGKTNESRSLEPSTCLQFGSV